MTLLDYNERLRNTEMGTASFELVKLQDDATLKDCVAPVLRDGKQRGELRFDL